MLQWAVAAAAVRTVLAGRADEAAGGVEAAPEACCTGCVRLAWAVTVPSMVHVTVTSSAPALKLAELNSELNSAVPSGTLALAPPTGSPSTGGGDGLSALICAPRVASGTASGSWAARLPIRA